jgi:predicted dehydrogenase
MNRTADIAIFALDRQIHCLCEKPLAVDPGQLTRLEEAVRRSGARLLSLLPMRYDPAFYTMRQLVLQGAIGEPVLVSMQKSYKLGHRADYFHKRAVYGGIFAFIGAHTLDLTCFVTGKRLKTISAYQTASQNGGNKEMESCGVLQFTFAGGLGVNTLDYFRPESAGTWADNRMRVAGTYGILETYFDKVYLITRDHGTREMPLQTACTPFADFIDDIREGTDRCILKGEDCLYNAKVALLARQAADTGTVLRMPE